MRSKDSIGLCMHGCADQAVVKRWLENWTRSWELQVRISIKACNSPGDHGPVILMQHTKVLGGESIEEENHVHSANHLEFIAESQDR